MAVNRPPGMRSRQSGYRKEKFDQTPSNHGWYYCEYCKKSGRKAEMEVDHILPQAQGGSDDISNLAISCRACNRSKGNQTPEMFGIMKMLREDDEAEKLHREAMRDYKKFFSSNKCK